jgi:hypothetical protein
MLSACSEFLIDTLFIAFARCWIVTELAARGDTQHVRWMNSSKLTRSVVKYYPAGGGGGGGPRTPIK